MAAQPGQQIGAHAGQPLVAAQQFVVQQAVDQRQPGRRPLGHADGDRTVQLDHPRALRSQNRVFGGLLMAVGAGLFFVQRGAQAVK